MGNYISYWTTSLYNGIVGNGFGSGVCAGDVKAAEDSSQFAKERANSILKGLLFVQEMFHESNIDYFMEKYPEKYSFLRGNVHNETPGQTTSIFQGSTAEELAIFSIDETESPENWYGQMRFDREFDYDIMHVKERRLIEDDDFCQVFCDFVNKQRPEKSLESKMKLWGKAAFCKHLEEPLVVMPARDGDGKKVMVEHVGLFRPGCSKCISTQDQSKVIIDFNGRMMLATSPHQMIWECAKDCIGGQYQESGKCHCSMLEGHNRYGDLCGKCSEANTHKIKHNKNAHTEVVMDQAIFTGPSLCCTFYLKSFGENSLPELPLFNEEDSSLIRTDNIFAFRYPKVLYHGKRWPAICIDFVLRERPSCWPGRNLIDKVVEAGCHIVPKKAYRTSETHAQTLFKFFVEHLWISPTWRLSFSVSEKILAQAFTQPQRKCFLLLKVFFSAIGRKINSELYQLHGEDYEPFLVTSFLLKHVMFWTLENVPQEEWRFNNLYACILHVINQFEKFLEKKVIPHYFIGARKNLLAPDVVIGDDKDEKKVDAKVDVLLKGIRILKQPAGLDNVIMGGISAGAFDYQWNVKSTLLNPPLVETFLQMHQYPSKARIVAHHRSMIHAIEKAPRKYGHGVNTGLVDFLKDEIELLEKPDSSVGTLDAKENDEVVAKLASKLRRDRKMTEQEKLMLDVYRTRHELSDDQRAEIDSRAYVNHPRLRPDSNLNEREELTFPDGAGWKKKKKKPNQKKKKQW